MANQDKDLDQEFVEAWQKRCKGARSELSELEAFVLGIVSTYPEHSHDKAVILVRRKVDKIRSALGPEAGEYVWSVDQDD